MAQLKASIEASFNDDLVAFWISSVALGRKTGGRRAGTPNRRSIEFLDKLTELNLDPLAELVAISKNSDVTAELRARILMDLMGYVYPKRKALQTHPPGAQPVVFNIDFGQSEARERWMGTEVNRSKVDVDIDAINRLESSKRSLSDGLVRPEK